MKTKKFSFTVSMVTLLSLFTFMIFLFLTLNFYNRGLSQAYEIVNEKNSEATNAIAEYISTSISSVNAHLTVLSAIVKDADEMMDAKELLQNVMWQQLLSDKNMASIFLADNHGTFLQARRFPEYAIRTLAPSVQGDMWEYKDDAYNTLKVQTKPIDYDPRVRQWYQSITEDKSMTISSPYLFSSTKEPGITVSYGYIDTDTNVKRVAAVDFTLASLSSLLRDRSKGMDANMVIYDHQGKVVATSFNNGKNLNKLETIETIESEKYNFLKNIAYDKSERYGEIVTDEVEYIYFVHALKTSSDQEWYLASLIEKQSIVGEINNTLFTTIAISSIIIFILYFITHFLLQKFFIRPIHLLREKTEDIAKYKFDNIDIVNTNIKEFHELSKSMVLMATSIQKYEQDLKNLLDSFIKILSESIDAKSPYTGRHCERVSIIAKLLVKAASESNEEIFKNFHFTKDEQWREFEIAAWLHDCGKIITPEYVVDKATKLETIYNRIHEVRTRFEVLHRDQIIDFYQNLKKNPEKEAQLKEKLENTLKKLQDDFAFVAQCNVGVEFMSEDKIQRLEEIAQTKWTRYFDDNLGLSHTEILRKAENITSTPCEETLLMNKQEHIIPRERLINEKEYKEYGFKVDIPQYDYNNGELYNLKITKGTLTQEERFKIYEHAIMTIKMLEQLPFTDDLKRIPEYAGSHHETMVGTGYPRKLTKEQISIPARIMAIADIFEALTASDRPYRPVKNLSESIKIMNFMMKDGHIDEDLFKLFLTSGVYKIYANQFLKQDQIDEIDISEFI